MLVMKNLKLFILTAAAVTLLAASCSKENSGSQDPVCKKISLVFDLKEVSSDVLDNFDITFSGKDFDGNEFTKAVTSTGQITFTVANANLTDKDAYPFTMGVSIKSKGNVAAKEGYDANLVYGIYFHGYDANGGEFVDGDGHMVYRSSKGTISDSANFVRQIENMSEDTETYKFWFCQTISGSWHVGWTLQ